MKAIAAVNNKNYIGKDGHIMWRCSEDFKHFKKMTMGGILIVGANTFRGDFNERYDALPGRELIVVGKNYCSLWNAVQEAILMSRLPKYGSSPDNIWVIGGETIYTQLMPLITEFHLSRINDDQVGDKKLVFPQNFRGKIIDYHFEPNKPKVQG